MAPLFLFPRLLRQEGIFLCLNNSFPEQIPEKKGAFW